MVNSHTSDLLSESADIFCCSPTEESTDTDVYKSLVFHIKSTFSNIETEIKSPSFSTIFCNLLDDCNSCILQSLELVTSLLAETNVNNDQMIEYINDAICIMQLLADLISNITECKPISYCSMKQFPVVTAHIIMRVFTHCKDSESLYGNQLKSVEKQIKDLFRTCHKLQLIYLMVIEKHCIFDLTEKEEQIMLIEALEINLKIGEIVQSLDVKTMAEQWRAFTMLCEKYSDTLTDKQIYSDCIDILCALIVNNIKIALKENQEKVIVRSLKVSSFTLKILQRICTIFKHASVKDYSKVIELLVYVNLNNEAYFHSIHEKSTLFTDIYNNNITIPVNNLLFELLHDDNLLQYIWDYNIENIKSDDNLLGYINLVISIIKLLLQKGNNQVPNLQKYKLINAIYAFLPYCHLWFNMGLRYNFESTTANNYQTYGLYEYLLTHTIALTSTINSEEFKLVERRMLRALLSTDCVSAMFSYNLWSLLARMSSRELLFSQVVSLSKIYQKLEINNLFLNSPQSIHLRHTIDGLFHIMVDEDKMKIYSMFNIRDDKNLNLWRCLKISNLPKEVQCNTEEFATKKLQMYVRQLSLDENVDVDMLIKSTYLASTCAFLSQDGETEFLVAAWTKACPKNITHIIAQFHRGMLWYYKYIEALADLTEAMIYVLLRNSIILVKVLHVISNIIFAGCREFKILLIDILCKLANFEVNDLNEHLLHSILTETLQDLFTTTDSIVRNKLFNALRIYKNNNLYRILSDIVNKDESLKDVWIYFIKHGRLKIDFNLKEQLHSAVDLIYCHKCIEDFKDTGSLILQKTLSNNFDIDIEMLLEPDEEPACKKSKLNASEVQEIITRLETDTNLLCNIKENVFTSENKNKIKTICNKLNNIVH